MERTDEELIRAYASGEPDAVGLLFARHKGSIFNFALRLIGNRADAEDVTSDIFLQLFNRRYQPIPQVKFTTWLFAVARNACLSRIRSRNMLGSFWFKRDGEDGFEEQEVVDPAENQGEALRSKEKAKMVKRAVLDLPHPQKEALILREYFSKDYAEIAVILGCSLDNVKVLIFRGRERLRISLAAWMKEETL
ncbi:MAG: sigma-70 family RNA polymerase sigma factor [Candidatus Omnitrophota bacterium]